jgi:LysM repeat protein
MKIKQIARATLLPAAVAGLAISTGTAASAAAQRPAHGKPAHPAEAGSTHQWVTVRAGETLSAIAAAHHMSWQAVYATPPNARHLGNPNVVLAGQRLRIPADPKLRAAQFRTRYAAALQRQSAAGGPAPADPARPGAQASAGGQSTVASTSAFEQCVAWRESGDNPTDPDGLFGILPSTWASLGYSGSAGEASVGQQEQAFSRLYAEDGTQPWAPYDGC